MEGPLAEGWVLALTDYPGLGTPGPHPYLVGESQGRAVLDSVRAAHALDADLDLGLDLDDRVAVWGHSQGGHAAAFTGQIAERYAPEQEIVGVAAFAPATRLADNLAAIEGTVPGDLLAIYAEASWREYFDDIPDGTIAGPARRQAAQLAGSCLNQPSRFRIVVAGLTLPDTVLTVDPSTDPVWSAHLDANTPDPAGVTAPLFVAQGDDDEVVNAAVTETWVSERCAAGAPTTWTLHPGLDHVGVLEPGGPAALAWTIDRFAGAPPDEVCPA